MPPDRRSGAVGQTFPELSRRAPGNAYFGTGLRLFGNAPRLFKLLRPASENLDQKRLFRPWSSRMRRPFLMGLLPAAAANRAQAFPKAAAQGLFQR